ncbi:hypothetical protein [Phycisphaera mikurensis]|uniref:Uncharacterized protein n=1 Tax=Phycisphaera mikurensis (strain NBRC 102666 / KCTC 22515 / FYK2301M01) TaxID=1142394 RepID=I0II92_PHYMF|nr:hypothetical protein [Phycisphaera mikurensis]MBB6442457.1 hypothetical protein [Phycisphaera mikurensis]BAM04980.1 hypothetical protein PSMK_28210 [Phycisphaera mikurensis NBRC 102666]
MNDLPEPERERGPRPDPPEPGFPRAVAVVRGGRRYAFDCPEGGESALIAKLAPLVADPACALTWYDAALLCHQLRGRLARRIDEAAA